MYVLGSFRYVSLQKEFKKGEMIHKNKAAKVIILYEQSIISRRILNKAKYLAAPINDYVETF